MGGRSLKWWCAPLWILQLATGAKSFVDNPIIGSSRLNRLGLHAARLKLAHRLAWWRRRRLARLMNDEDRMAFDRDGYRCIHNFLPEDQFARLRDFLLTQKWPAREHRQGDTITRRIPIDDVMVRQCPELGQLLRSPRWKGLMRYVASTGGEPLYYLQTIITGGDGPADPQLQLHSDSFQPSLKAWFFLADVASNEAAFTYVAGSHRLTSGRLEWEKKKSVTIGSEGDRLSQRGSFRICREELAQLGLPEPIAIAVPANSLVVADTFGFHARGASDHPVVRAEIWAYRRRSPFLPWIGFDPLSIPKLALRRAQWRYRLIDWLAARGLAQQHWTESGIKSARDR